MGLHFNHIDIADDMKEMRRNLREYFTYFIQLSKNYGHIIIFRETSAQHFQTTNGLYSGEWLLEQDYGFKVNEERLVDNQIYFSPLIDPNKRKQYNTTDSNQSIERPDVTFCKPIRTKQELHENNWRNREVFKMLDELDPNHEHVHIAKFHEVTAGRHDMHAIGTDCTHFCPSPILWYPLWQNIYDIVERQYKLKSTRGHFRHVNATEA